MYFNNEELKQLNIEVSILRRQLDSLNSEKELWFKKKEEMKIEINGFIKNIKGIKAESDKKNIDISSLKKQRDRYNNEVKSLIKNIKKINKEKANVLKKYNIKIDPLKIHEKINDLERKVETEVDFEKEKKLMEEIRKLKKAFDGSSEIFEIAKKVGELETKIKESRKKADEFHKKIREITKDANYDSFLNLSSKITVLKKDQEDAFQNFIESKKKYGDISRIFRDKSEKLEMLKLVFSKEKKTSGSIKESNNHTTIEMNSQKVEAKLKSMKRITTEDLLKIQGDIAE